MALLRGKKKWYLKHLQRKFFHFLQKIILSNQNNQNNWNDQNDQGITINIFHRNQIIQIHQIAHHKLMVSVTQATY